MYPVVLQEASICHWSKVHTLTSLVYQIHSLIWSCQQMKMESSYKQPSITECCTLEHIREGRRGRLPMQGTADDIYK